MNVQEALVLRNPPASAGDRRDAGFTPGSPTAVFLPGESQGRGSLVGCRLWGCTESDTTDETQQQQQEDPLEKNMPACSTLGFLPRKSHGAWGATNHRVTESGITEVTQHTCTHVKGSNAEGRTLDKVEPGATRKELLVLKGHFILIVSIFHKV